MSDPIYRRISVVHLIFGGIFRFFGKLPPPTTYHWWIAAFFAISNSFCWNRTQDRPMKKYRQKLENLYWKVKIQDKAYHSQQGKYPKSDPVASRNIEGASGHQRSGRTAQRAAGQDHAGAERSNSYIRRLLGGCQEPGSRWAHKWGTQKGMVSVFLSFLSTHHLSICGGLNLIIR